MQAKKELKTTQKATSNKAPSNGTSHFNDQRPIANRVTQLQDIAQRKPNQTGMPDNLKSGIENLSGHSMDDVKVHYNSAKPAQLQAHAYAQGNQIHLGPGQEKHLSHEAWHVVQQKQGRVKPTMQMKGKVNINDDAGLEKEADVMGAKALQMKESSVLQLAKCKSCGFENAHAQNCTPESRKNEADDRLEAQKKQHDKSMDGRTREDQSHPQHGGDAKGRKKKYDKWKK